MRRFMSSDFLAGFRGKMRQNPSPPDAQCLEKRAGLFQFTRPQPMEVEAQIRAAANLASDGPDALALVSGMRAAVPAGFVRDHSRTVLGHSNGVFTAARHAMEHWLAFDLGWVQVAHPRAPIATGQVVAVIAHTATLWSVNLSRIVETADTPRLFGFLYSTTPAHVEQGEERFLIEHHEDTGDVSYTIEAVSRPRSILAQLAYPYTRAMQHRFARESLARMRMAIKRETS